MTSSLLFTVSVHQQNRVKKTKKKSVYVCEQKNKHTKIIIKQTTMRNAWPSRTSFPSIISHSLSLFMYTSSSMSLDVLYFSRGSCLCKRLLNYKRKRKKNAIDRSVGKKKTSGRGGRCFWSEMRRVII